MTRRRRPAGALRRPAVAVLLLFVAACTGDQPPPPDEPTPVRPAWTAVALPTPPGPPGRLMLRDAATCGSDWYAAGGVITPDDQTRPALWTTTDPTGAAGWSVVPIDTSDDYYAIRSILYAIGCRDGRIAVIGARSGGGHGNPRVRTFYQRPDGGLKAVPSTDFLLYGGPAQVSVNRMAGGPTGWLIAGNRDGGAAVWTSPDATLFTIHENLPVLSNDAGLSTAANDAVAEDTAWLVVGSGRPPDRIDRDPLAWTTRDGTAFTRVPLPGTSEDEVAQRVLRTGDGTIALGVAGPGFAAWRGDAAGTGDWRPAVRFGATGTGAIAGIESAAIVEDHLLAATVAADGHALWRGDLGGDGWRPVALPAPVPPGGFTAAAVAGRGGAMLLLTDDGVSPQAWAAPVAAS